MVEFFLNVGISTCYVGFRGEKKIYLLAMTKVMFAIFFLLVRIWSYTAKFEILVTLDRNWS